MAVNEYGTSPSCETRNPVRASEIPTAPNKLIVTDKSAKSVSLAWSKPDSDCGSKITGMSKFFTGFHLTNIISIYPFICQLGYLIEYRESGSEQWKQFSQVKNMSETVNKLLEGREYYFRVKALNENGLGDARELLHPVAAKELVSDLMTLRR